MSKIVERDCPLCGSDYLLKYRDPKGPEFDNYLYCPSCDTLFRPSGGELIAAVKTIEPYADFWTSVKGWNR